MRSYLPRYTAVHPGMGRFDLPFYGVFVCTQRLLPANWAAIEEDDFRNFGGGVSTIYLSAESIFDQFGQQTAMIQMGMG